jgi:hypothetical protein
MEADRSAYRTSHWSREEEQRRMEAYSRQLTIMRNALVNLTRLDCFVSEDSFSGALSDTTGPLFNFLCGANKLQRLGIGFGEPFKGHLVAGMSLEHNAPSALLDLLAEHKPWPNIKELHLRVATDEDTLLRFLGAHKDTLDTLTLSHMSLISLGSANAFWEAALYKIGKTLRLNALTLHRLCDVVRDNGGSYKMRILFDQKHRSWRGNEHFYPLYHKNAVQCVTQGEILGSLEPEAFLQRIQAE